MPLPTTANVSRPQALGYGALLDDLYLRLVGNPELQSNPQIETLRPEATRIDTGQNPEDFISEVGQTFSRAQFAGGEGLGFAHREGSAKDRYWDSDGVDVGLPEPGDLHAAKLSHDGELIRASSESSPQLATDGESVWVSEDKGNVDYTLYRSDDPLDGSPTFAEDDPSAGEGAVRVDDLTVLGGEVYAALGGNGVHLRDTAGTWTHWSDLEAVLVWGVKRRVVGVGKSSDGDHTKLYEVKSGAGSVLLATLPPGHNWRDVTDAGSHVLAAADDGYVYALTADDGADMALESQTEIPFEEPRRLTSIGGLVFVGTRVSLLSGEMGRLWRASLAGDGALVELDLIKQFGGGDDHDKSSYDLLFDSERVNISVAEFGGTDRVTIWRYDAKTGGLSRALELDAFSGLRGTTDMASIGGRVFATVHDEGLYREGADLFGADGYLITPAADFFTALDKSWQEVTVDAELPTGDDGTDTKVEAYYATDLDAMDDPNSSLWTLAGTVTPSSTSDTFQITGVQSRFIVLMVKLYSSTDQTATPEVNSVAVTATIVAEEVSIQLPVNVSDVIELPGRKRHNLYGLGERVYQQLRAKHGKEATLELFRPAEKIRGVVWSVSAPVPSVSSRGERTVVCNVEVRGKPTS